MPVGRGLFINGPPEVQLFQDSLGRHIEIVSDDLDEHVMVYPAGAKIVDMNGDRLRDADGIRKLHFHFAAQPDATMFFAI